MGAVVNCVAYADGRRVAEVKVSQISEVLEQPEQFVWIGLREPDEGLLRTVQKEFGLHDLAIEDAYNAHQRPKVEVTVIRFSWCYERRRSPRTELNRLFTEKPTSSSVRTTWFRCGMDRRSPMSRYGHAVNSRRRSSLRGRVSFFTP